MTRMVDTNVADVLMDRLQCMRDIADGMSSKVDDLIELNDECAAQSSSSSSSIGECECLSSEVFMYGAGGYRTEAVISGDGAGEIATDDWYLGNVELGSSINGVIEFSACNKTSLDWWINYDNDSDFVGTFKIYVNNSPTPSVDIELTAATPSNPIATVTGTINLPNEVCEVPVRIEGMLPTSNNGNIFLRFKVTGVS